MQRLIQYRLAILGGLCSLLLPGTASALELPRQFDVLDQDADGQVSFAEFSAYARTQDVSTTQAAQHFIKLSAGDATLTEPEFDLATGRTDTASSQDTFSLPPMTEAVSDVERADLTAMEPVEAESVILEKTPNEEVMGELIRAFEDDRNPDDIVQYAKR